MQVFVLCTGRCGSTTFAQACAHMTNFTVGHESRRPRLGAERFAYPVRHIEVDNRLAWMIGRLERYVGDSAYYVHLRRDPDAVAASFVRRSNSGIMRAYRQGVLMSPPGQAEPEQLAADMCDTIEANIELFLRDKTHVMPFWLETAREDFPRFWEWIGAAGDLAAGLAEFGVRHNPSPPGRSPAR